ncbi:MAG: hydrogenase iron-sulfur subunit, partial [Chloroflexi bacterium]|nr:hydrogenase iron-sulfur subunit [Chloroflexota bacterium]
LGVDKGRVMLEWVSASEGARFARVVNEFTDQVRQLGPAKRLVHSFQVAGNK